MRRLLVALAAVLAAVLTGPPPAQAYVRPVASGMTVPVRVGAGLPVVVWPPDPEQVRLHKGVGLLAGTLDNPNGFHRWVGRLDWTVTATTKCALEDFAVTPVAGGLPPGGASLPPHSVRPWLVQVTSSGHNKCREAVVTVSSRHSPR